MTLQPSTFFPPPAQRKWQGFAFLLLNSSVDYTALWVGGLPLGPGSALVHLLVLDMYLCSWVNLYP